MTDLDRRAFLAGAAAPVLAAPFAALSAAAPAPRPFAPARSPVVIASGNGFRADGPCAVATARARLLAGARACAAVVAGVTLVEDDPNDMSVGFGGLPNEDGVVQLDASVMDGPLHKAGAVAGLEGIRNPAQVALRVLEETDHVLLVGEGAKRFALRQGFKEENLLTDRAREAWLKWRRNLNPDDDWMNDDQMDRPRDVDPRRAMAEAIGVPFTWGTIHCAAVDAQGDLGACTTTSGLSWKIPGRVGDSPIVGAGMFVDNAIGAAGATGRGESLIQSCGAFQIVRWMGEGVEPAEACLRLLRWIADHTKRKSLLNERGEPNFGATVYALRKDGAFGAANLRGRARYAVCDADGPRLVEAAVLYS